ncbi:hypothetical protein NIES22_35920 [Calothrix brevissima NIES-22]|nr:hypothetical protein NIES22_35920 [Calothrix brevissima NIES-22]
MRKYLDEDTRAKFLRSIHDINYHEWSAIFEHTCLNQILRKMGIFVILQSRNIEQEQYYFFIGKIPRTVLQEAHLY